MTAKAKSYKEYRQLDYAKVGEDMLAWWNENDIFQKSISSREGRPSFTFYEGPPSANGTPGIHHVMARAVKDIFCRYKTMQGFQVLRKGGWDTHGLPVELQVEKELGITKEDIGKKISVEEYNRRCREAVMKFKDEWDTLTRQMGFWVDLDNPYVTFEKEYIESVWAILKKLFEKDLLYKGYTIQPFSPAAGTGLSSHELNQPGCYRDVKDTSIVAQFKVEGTDNDFLLAWTTTPWTLPSNSALAVGENIDYVKVRTFNQYTFKEINVYLAKALVKGYFSEKQLQAEMSGYAEGDKLIPAEIVAEMKGRELVGMKYGQLMPYVQPDGKAFEVIAGDFVSTEDGTGIVHISPTFGADDYRVAKQAGMAAITVTDENGDMMPLVDKQGRFVSEVTDFAGAYVKGEYEEDEVFNSPDYKSTDVLIAIKLKEENRAFKVEKYEHSYPHCWRTDKPILYYPLDSWFIKTTAVKDRMVELNKTINWKPESTGTGRFGNWLENLVDWNLSRSRYWGTPLPLWMTEDRKEIKCIGSVAELEAEIAKAVEAGVMDSSPYEGKEIDLHRPYVDDIVLLSESGQPMRREPDLIDVWFDSGSMPYAQWHWPFENDGKMKENFPADFIAEGVDQTRGWFFTLHAIAVMLFDSVAYKNVIANGLVLDKEGNKMSKRLGNAVNPFETIATYGADPTRWYMVTNAMPWDNLKFNEDGITEVQRRLFGTLQNTYSFFALYANIDGYDRSGQVDRADHTESDLWVLSKLNTVTAKVTAAYEDYEPTRAGRVIQDFVSDDLSNWYVRLNRKRFWKGEYNADKKAAYQTLYTCLETVAKLAAPIAPFYMDLLYQNLNAVSGADKAESVHIADFPKVDESMLDMALEQRMDYAQTISSLVHSLRKKDRLKVRQPLRRILLPALDEGFADQVRKVETLILSEVNVKQIEYIDDTSDVLVKSIKPNFKKLGKEYGPKMKDVSKLISSFGKEEIAILEKNEGIKADLGGEEITLTREDVEISSQDIPGWSVATENGITVALDITLTEDLRQEGIARDLVNRIQNLRKSEGLDVMDRITVTVGSEDLAVRMAAQNHEAYITEETQADALSVTEDMVGEILEMDEYKIGLQVEKV